jgi:hypothetical protein
VGERFGVREIALWQALPPRDGLVFLSKNKRDAQAGEKEQKTGVKSFLNG